MPKPERFSNTSSRNASLKPTVFTSSSFVIISSLVFGLVIGAALTNGLSVLSVVTG